MAEKINVVGAKPKKVEVVEQPKPRIDPVELAAALGASPSGLPGSGHLDPIGLAELGTHLLSRLRSSGGRPALADATVNCRVPLSAADVETLENMVSRINASTGAKPSVGQLISALVRQQLNALQTTPDSPDSCAGTAAVCGEPQGGPGCEDARAHDSSWLDAKNGKREKYRRAQELVQKAGTTWGKKRVA
jgi:hypothetical protein